MDLVDLYRRSLAEFTGRVRQVRPDQWSAPTPCPDWDVHALVNHVVGEDLWTVPIFAGQTIAEVGDRFDGDVIGADPAGTAFGAADRAADAVAEPGALDRIVHLSFGDHPGAEYAWQLLADHLVHAWDLAAAIGADRRMDPAVVSALAEWFADREDFYRDGGAIGPRLEVPAAAGEWERLLGRFGRDPDWPARPA
jgi:uncharacterized protein (TIGR03086 family)